MKRSLIFLFLFVFSLSIFAQKVEQESKKVQLSDLPQNPRVPKETTDAQDEGLKGKVRKTVEETKSLSGPWAKYGRKISDATYFDENGFFLLKELYQIGKLHSTTLYGYIENKRVSKTVYPTENQDKVFRIATNKNNSEQQNLKEPDTRYGLSFLYEYKDGKLVEMKLFRNTGATWLRHVYTYSDNQIIKTVFTEDDRVNVHSVIKIDDKGNEIEKSETVNSTIFRRYRYKYEFDKQGNWTKQVALEEVTENGKTFFKPDYEIYRTITYW
jgi:hypothetical protein